LPLMAKLYKVMELDKESIWGRIPWIAFIILMFGTPGLGMVNFGWFLFVNNLLQR
jgi:hypothetical protein